MDEVCYSFLDFTLELATERLRRGTSQIKLRPKSFQVLRYLVEHPRRVVTREELLQAVWGDVSVTDESLSKCIADVRRSFGPDFQEVIRTVPRRGFLFEPEVRIVEQPVPAITIGDQWPTIKMRLALLAGLTLIAVVAVLLSMNRRPGATYQALAVLPFESLSGGSDQQYLADGMTEALITNLGQASPLRVIARTSVNHYRKTQKTIQEIARELSVDLLIEGTVVQSGEHLRVTANLIQVSPEKHIWARAYQRDFKDVLALQNEITNAISQEVQGKLKPQETSPSTARPVNPDAQLAYWKSQYFQENGVGSDDLHKRKEYAERAVRLDPEYAPAQAALARAYIALSDSGLMLPNEIMPRARAAAERAIKLDERLSFGHVSLGTILLVYDWDWAAAQREARRSIILNPSDAEAHWLLSNYFAAVGNYANAVAEMRRARELDPVSFHKNWSVGRMLCVAREYDKALAELRQAGEMQRNSSAVDIWTFKAFWMKGQFDDAIATDLRIRDYRDHLEPKSLDELRTAYRQGGVRRYWAKLRELTLPKFSSDPTGWYRLAEINTYLGDKEQAFKWLGKAFPERPNWITYLKADPSLDPLRPDPRFAEFLRQMGLTP